MYIVMYKGIFTPNSRHETKFNHKEITAKEPEKENHDTISKDYEVIRRLVMEKESNNNQRI